MLSFSQPKAIVGIDVGSYAVKAVALQASKERVTLAGYAQARIEKQDVSEVIKKVIGQLGVKPRRVVTSVSGRSVIVRQVETPRLEGDELRKHIAHEADKYIPFGAEEVVIDCQPLPDRPGAKNATLQVMLVAVRKSFIQEHIAQLKAAGIAPEIIDVDVFALANAYELFGPPALPDADKKATALIDIGASKSNIAIVQGSHLLFTREVYLAGNEISDVIARTFNEPVEDIDRIKLAPGETLEAMVDAAMPAFEDLANEIRLSFDYVEGQFEIEVSQCVLTGGSAQLPTAAAVLGNILGRPVHVFDPLAGLDLVPSRYDIHGLDANSPSLAVVLGLAAHQLGFGKTGLGGQQSHAWQPRNAPATSGGGGGHEAANAAAVTAVTMPPAIDQAAESMATVPPPARFATPVPPDLVPPPAHSGTSRVTSTIAAPPPMSGAYRSTPSQAGLMPPSVTPPPTLAPAITTPSDPLGGLPDDSMEQSTSSQTDLVGRSGLLVVLDDDQEMPPPVKSERIASAKPSTVFKIDGFDDEDDKGKDEPQLPELPKL
jgi:type IV pilus assembly protein PilM